MINFLPAYLLLLLLMTGILKASPPIHLHGEIIGLEHSRMKRSRACHAKFQIIPMHTACLDRSYKVLESGVDENEATFIVDEHNRVRSEVLATNMLKMSWDDEVAFIAERWAENCYTDHDSNYNRYIYGRFSVGQNLAWASYKMTWSRAIKLWADEKAYYTYGSSTGINDQPIGHYTQMVWAESVKIGCGYANCAGTHYYVCNYAPAGNMNSAYPYKLGRKCADCASTCSNGLCDCGNKVCLNGANMDLNTCKCTCNRGLPFYLQPSCSLNCTGIKDPSYCPSYGQSGCSKYVNVPQECPSMCDWCPASGATFDAENKTGPLIYSTSVIITASGATFDAENKTGPLIYSTSVIITALLFVLSLY